MLALFPMQMGLKSPIFGYGRIYAGNEQDMDLSPGEFITLNEPLPAAALLTTAIINYTDNDWRFQMLNRTTAIISKSKGLSFIIILYMFTLSGCDSNRELYENAISAFGAGDFNEALTMFNSLPKQYKDVDLFSRTSSAVIEYKSGSWLNAVRSFESLSIQLNEIFDNQKKYPNEYLVKLVGDLLIPLGRAFNTSSDQSIPFEMVFSLGWVNSYMNKMKSFVEDPAKYSSFRYINKRAQESNLYGDLYYESLFRFYEEQTQLGYDIAELPEYPFKRVSAKEIDFLDILYNRRMEKLTENIKEFKLENYYAKTDNSVSPVEVTGTGIYVNTTKARETRRNCLKIISFFPPSCLADAPENVRYVLIFTEEYSYYGTYTDGTEGYVTTINAVLKDTATGKIIYRNRFTSNPPDSVYIQFNPDNVYGNWDRIGNDFIPDILPALEKIFTIYDWHGTRTKSTTSP